MNRIFLLLLLVGVYVLLDIYAWQAIRHLIQGRAPWLRTTVLIVYIGLSIYLPLSLLLYNGLDVERFRIARIILSTAFFAIIMGKLFMVVLLAVDDLGRGLRWVAAQFGSSGAATPTGTEGGATPGTSAPAPGNGNIISRSEFLTKTALAAAVLPGAAMSFGIISGAHDYRIRRKTIYLPNLPKAWHGVTLAQLSDIHSGSFFNKTAVQGGVDMLLDLKPDLVFFTGDIVNDETSELRDYAPVFARVKAPLGVYATLGNHDYGDYRRWASPQAKAKNLQDLVTAETQMGWQMLRNENRILTQSGEPLAIIGVENWGVGRFSRYGNLQEAYQGAEEAPVKLLLSHDPSHWDAQVRPDTPDVDVTFSGHTHGFQFGVEWGNFRWSPSQYVYKQWAGLYKAGQQYLYVNRGFGYIGYTGRIGILPEITLFTLERGTPPAKHTKETHWRA